ncbi:alpha/beta hydrolase family protein [Arenimonas alkanexedens]
MRPFLLAWLLSWVLLAAPAQAEPLPAEVFLAPADIASLTISPDGEHYAATVPLEDRTALVILRRSDMKRSGYVMFKAETHVTNVHWVNNQQLVYSDARRMGPLAAPRASGRLYKINADGSEGGPIVTELAFLHHTLRGDDEHVQVIRRSAGATPRLVRLNINTGKFVGEQVKHPLDGGSFHSDNAGVVRFASGYKDYEIRSRQFQRDDDGEWREINSEEETGVELYFTGFSADNKTAYLIIESPEGPDGLYAYDMATGVRTLVARHERVDIGQILRSPLDGGVIGVVFLAGKPEVKLIAPEDPFAKALAHVMRAFPGSYVTPTSYTRDGRIGIYHVSSDVNSGEYYRVDHEAGGAAFVIAANERQDPRLMAPMQAISFKARDGVQLDGFVTVPRNAGGKPVPLVVVPHGGPKGIFDVWGFDSEVQLLASRGYAVLQLNFRGSGNYGRAFRESGNGEWGAKMQDDVTDATQWAINEGIAAPGRICLYGASYGAYAAMMGLVREPDLYACGIGNVGLYDLVKMYKADANSRFGRDYFGTALGDVDLATISPARLADRIRVPVLLGAGSLDETTPLEQTRAMQSGLKAADAPADVRIYDLEAHGYYQMKNRRDWSQRVLSFLEAHIGEPRPAPGAP